LSGVGGSILLERKEKSAFNARMIIRNAVLDIQSFPFTK